MIVVHHLNNSRSQRVLWLLEELGVEYEVRRYERHPATMRAPPELKAVHPLGRSPVLSEGELTLAETGLIVQYLCDHHGDGSLAPPRNLGADAPERLRWLYWLHYAEGSAMPPLLMKLVFDVLQERSPFLVKPVVRIICQKALEGFVLPELTLHMDYWESTLAGSGWFCGPAFSAADVMMSFPVETAAVRADLSGRPALKRFLDQIHARPAYQRALERGGPYAYAGS